MVLNSLGSSENKDGAKTSVQVLAVIHTTCVALAGPSEPLPSLAWHGMLSVPLPWSCRVDPEPGLVCCDLGLSWNQSQAVAEEDGRRQCGEVDDTGI